MKERPVSREENKMISAGSVAGGLINGLKYRNEEVASQSICSHLNKNRLFVVERKNDI